ncbi:MAG: exported protein of unknown function [Candidatus Thorarchaeota archaeon]|nr:MAG: exported protein of unknown function [Candidatus Thorarchaeota archaeon]
MTKTNKANSGRSLRPRVVLFGVLFSLFFVMSTVSGVSAYPAYPTSPRIAVSIETAYYTCLDGDGMENDVFSVIKFELSSSWIYEYYYWITLELPSGASYCYEVHVFAWTDTIYLRNVFFDYATESGDYTIHVDALLISPYWDSDTVSHTFDPPGGSPGGEPTLVVY